MSDTEEPGFYAGFPLESIQTLPDSDKNLLQKFFGNRLVGDYSHDVAVDIAAKAMIKFSKGVFVTTNYKLGELVILEG
jgi:hypothetical protein